MGYEYEVFCHPLWWIFRQTTLITKGDRSPGVVSLSNFINHGIYICHLLISRVHRQSHFLLIVQPRAAMLDQWPLLSFVVQRNGSPQIQKQVYLQRGEMGFQVLHLRATRAEDDSYW